MDIIGHIKTNRTSYKWAILSLCALVLMIGSYNAGHRDARANLNTTPSVGDIMPSDTKALILERCIFTLVLTGDFAPKHCSGIQEDDERLILAYETIKADKPEYTKSDKCKTLGLMP